MLGCTREAARARLDRLERHDALWQETVWPANYRQERRDGSLRRTRITLGPARLSEGTSSSGNTGERPSKAIPESESLPPTTEWANIHVIQSEPIPATWRPTEKTQAEFRQKHPEMCLDKFIAHFVSKLRERGENRQDADISFLHWASHEKNRSRFNHGRQTDTSEKPAATCSAAPRATRSDAYLERFAAGDEASERLLRRVQAYCYRLGYDESANPEGNCGSSSGLAACLPGGAASWPA